MGRRSLNLSGSVITHLYEARDWTSLIPRAEAWIAIARRAGPDVNASAILSVETYRICALERSGRGAEAAMAAAAVEAGASSIPESALQLYACRNDLAAARALAIRALAQPLRRGEMLALLQPDTARPMEQPMPREERFFYDRLRSDAEVRAAANRFGRLLPYPTTPTLPAGFDPLLAGPKGAPMPGAI